jgi:hypothetical protein
MYDEQIREDLTVVELTDKELDEVTGALYGDGFSPFFPSNNSTSLAVTSIAFTTNNNNSIF